MQYVSRGLRALGVATAVGAVALATAVPAFGQYDLLKEGSYENKTDSIRCSVVYQDFAGSLAATGEPIRLQTICSGDKIPGVAHYTVIAFNNKPRVVRIVGFDGREREFQIVYTQEEHRTLREYLKVAGFDIKKYGIVTSDSFVGTEAIQTFENMRKTISPENQIKY